MPGFSVDLPSLAQLNVSVEVNINPDQGDTVYEVHWPVKHIR